jgi:hypothetical protein
VATLRDSARKVTLIKAYSTTRDTTRREHLAQWLLPMALRDERAMALVSGLLEEMDAQDRSACLARAKAWSSIRCPSPKR